MRKLIVLLAAAAAPVAAVAQSTCTMKVSGTVPATTIPCSVTFARLADGYTLMLTHDGWSSPTRVTASFQIAAAPAVRTYTVADVKSGAVSCTNPKLLPGGWIARTATGGEPAVGSFTLSLAAVGTTAAEVHGTVDATLVYQVQPLSWVATNTVTIAATF